MYCAVGDCLTSKPKGCSRPRELWFPIYSCSTYMQYKCMSTSKLLAVGTWLSWASQIWNSLLLHKPLLHVQKMYLDNPSTSYQKCEQARVHCSVYGHTTNTHISANLTKKVEKLTCISYGYKYTFLQLITRSVGNTTPCDVMWCDDMTGPTYNKGVVSREGEDVNIHIESLVDWSTPHARATYINNKLAVY